jgi:hypothetical protein
MKIGEIVTYPSRDGDVWKFQQYFDNLQTIPAFSNLEYAMVSDKHDTEYYGLLDDTKQLVSILVLDKRDLPYWQISYTETVPNFRKQGCFRYLLMKSLDIHSTVLSDEHQTIEAKNAWKSLIQYPSDRIQFKMYNTRTGDIVSVEQEYVWNDSSEYVMMATNEHMNESIIQRSLIRDEYTTKTNRNFDGIWFGPQSSNDDYDNP